MAEYDAWAPDYDAVGRRDDGGRRASTSSSRARPPSRSSSWRRHRPRRDPDRARDGQARDRHRPLARDARRRPRARGDLPLEFRDGDFRDFELEEPVELVICPFRSLLHLPRPGPTSARVFESASPRRCVPAAASPSTPSLQPHDRRASSTGTTQDAERRSSHTLRYVPADNRIDDRAAATRATIRTLVGDEVRVGRPDRRRRARGRGALRLVRPASRSTTTRTSSSTSRASRLSAYDPIARLYDPWSASVVEDISFYVDEALAAGGERSSSSASARGGSRSRPRWRART